MENPRMEVIIVTENTPFLTPEQKELVRKLAQYKQENVPAHQLPMDLQKGLGQLMAEIEERINLLQMIVAMTSEEKAKEKMMLPRDELISFVAQSIIADMGSDRHKDEPKSPWEKVEYIREHEENFSQQHCEKSCPLK